MRTIALCGFAIIHGFALVVDEHERLAVDSFPSPFTHRSPGTQCFGHAQ